jgi:hypothetical protein
MQSPYLIRLPCPPPPPRHHQHSGSKCATGFYTAVDGACRACPSGASRYVGVVILVVVPSVLLLLAVTVSAASARRGAPSKPHTAPDWRAITIRAVRYATCLRLPWTTGWYISLKFASLMYPEPAYPPLRPPFPTLAPHAAWWLGAACCCSPSLRLGSRDWVPQEPCASYTPTFKWCAIKTRGHTTTTPSRQR